MEAPNGWGFLRKLAVIGWSVVMAGVLSQLFDGLRGTSKVMDDLIRHREELADLLRRVKRQDDRLDGMESQLQRLRADMASLKVQRRGKD